MKTKAPTVAIALLAFFFIFAAEAQEQASRLPDRITYAELARLMRSKTPPLLLDVRTAEEYSAGHIPGAVLAPYDELSASFAEPDKAKPIVVYCRSGRRSAIAKETLEAMGYSDVADFVAVSDWKGKLEGGN